VGKSAWDTWLSFPDATSVFKQLSSQPADVESCLSKLERFTVLLYDRTSNKMTVNEARKQLFSKKGRQMQDLPLVKLLCYSMPNVQLSKAGIAGIWLCKHNRNCPAHQNGVGPDQREVKVLGSHSGPHYRT
jgi:hypothetical protein